MSRALVIAAGAIIIPVVMALAVTNSDWFSGSSASAALLASDVRVLERSKRRCRPGIEEHQRRIHVDGHE